MLKCCYAIFWMYGSKNILFMLLLFKKRKSHKFSNFSYPGSGKVLTSAESIISGQKYCCDLMHYCLKYLFAQFGYDWTKNKEMVKEEGRGRGGGGPMDIPTYLTSKKPNPCRVNSFYHDFLSSVLRKFGFGKNFITWIETLWKDQLLWVIIF